MDLEVNGKWETDGQLTVLYKIGHLLIFFTKEEDPKFKNGQMVSREEVSSARPYKAIVYDINQIPSDAYTSLSFAWS